jgi:hypothetical protein
MSKRVYQRQIPLLLVSIISGLFIAEYFLVYEPLSMIKKELTEWGTIISLFILLFGNLMLLASHIRRLGQRDRIPGKEYFRSVVLIIFVIVFFALAFGSGPQLTSGALFALVWTNVYGIMGIGIAVGHHTFFTWHAIKRIITLRTLDVAVLLITTFFSLFMYITSAVATFPTLLVIAEWIKATPNTSAQRAALLAAAVGGIVLGIRALVMRETGLIEAEVT